MAPNYLTLEEFSSLALPDEFSRRANTLISNAIRPIEAQFSNQVPTLIRESENAIDARYQQLQNSAFEDHNFMQDTAGAAKNSFTAFTGLEDPLSWFTGTQDARELGLNEGCDFEADFVTSPNFDRPNVSDTLGSRHRSSDSGMRNSVSCSCVGVCGCLRASSSSMGSDQSAGTSRLASDDRIFRLLESLTRSNVAIEKRLLEMENRLQDT